MQKQIIECVPNFSEGRNMDVIKQITDEIEKVSGITLLDVDPGQATNRTYALGSPHNAHQRHNKLHLTMDTTTSESDRTYLQK